MYRFVGEIVDPPDGPDRDLTTLTLRFTDVLAQIDDLPQSKPLDAADIIAERRRQRLAARPS